MLTMLGYHRHIEDHKRNMQAYREMVLRLEESKM